MILFGSALVFLYIASIGPAAYFHFRRGWFSVRSLDVAYAPIGLLTATPSGAALLNRYADFWLTLDFRRVKGTYTSPKNPGHPLELNSDGTWFQQKENYGDNGYYQVEGKIVILKGVSSGEESRLKIEQNTLRAPDGTIWTK